MVSPVDTRKAPAVAAFVERAFTAMYPHGRRTLLPGVFDDVSRLFSGAHPDYAAVDLRYHDFEHTLQATVCLTQLLEGRHAAQAEPRLGPRQFELAVCAALLHDTGYLKLRSDREGTGAKYTYCHVLRSCAFTASYLPAVGATELETEAVLSAINCTGPAKQLGRLQFRVPADRVIGSALATADYLGQMAAPDYPDELEFLFEEFRESDDFLHVPPQQRAFASAIELMNHTPDFWKQVVLPKLEHEFQAVYRFLGQSHPDGRNPYIEAVEKNIALIAARVGEDGRNAAAR